MTRTFILSVALLLSHAGVAASASGPRQDEPRRYLDEKLVPQEGGAVSDFVPKGWKLEGEYGEASGDLNKDGVPDKVLRLVEDLPVEGKDGVYNTRYRALVVLFGKSGGGFARAAVASKLLACSLCSGVLGDPEGGNITVEVKNGVLNVGQLSGSREARDLTQRFRYDAGARRFVLIGEDVSDYDRAEGGGTSVSTNYLTGLRVTKKSRPTSKGGDITVSTRSTRVSTARRFIEDVDYEKQ